MKNTKLKTSPQKSAQKISTAPNIVRGDQSWLYTETVKDHFFNPRNLLSSKKEAGYKADGVGMVGSPACGDVMKVWIKVKPVFKVLKDGGGRSVTGGDKSNMKIGRTVLDQSKSRITDCKWQTFGCGSAIASTSMMSVMVTEKGGMTIENALKLKAMDINARLGGLPTIKIHCSILGDKALKEAIEDYLKKL
jgi:NifU-like protein involved in Fe-S cluster formation